MSATVFPSRLAGLSYFHAWLWKQMQARGLVFPSRLAGLSYFHNASGLRELLPDRVFPSRLAGLSYFHQIANAHRPPTVSIACCGFHPVWRDYPISTKRLGGVHENFGQKVSIPSGGIILFPPATEEGVTVGGTDVSIPSGGIILFPLAG